MFNVDMKRCYCESCGKEIACDDQFFGLCEECFAEMEITDMDYDDENY